MWHGLEGMGWGWLGMGFVHMVLFWVLVAVCIAILLAVMRSSRGRSALEILQIRYAKGELTREEYERMKHELAGDERAGTGK